MAKPTVGAPLSVRIPDATRKRLEDVADAENMDFSDLVRRILERAAWYQVRRMQKQGRLPMTYNKGEK